MSNSDANILYLVRHAKASWDGDTATDFERPLNETGLRDAPRMGDRLAERPDRPERVISSPALRAWTTAGIIAEALGMDLVQRYADESLYSAGIKEWLHAIRGVKESFSCVMMVGHNPSVTELVRHLTGSHIDNIPACGIATLRFPGAWSDVDKETGELLHFDIP